MIQITIDNKGYHIKSHFSESIFRENGAAEVDAICLEKQYYNIFDFENRICQYLTSLLKGNYMVTTHHVTIESCTGSDSNGTYVERAVFQIEIVPF